MCFSEAAAAAGVSAADVKARFETSPPEFRDKHGRVVQLPKGAASFSKMKVKSSTSSSTSYIEYYIDYSLGECAL